MATSPAQASIEEGPVEQQPAQTSPEPEVVHHDRAGKQAAHDETMTPPNADARTQQPTKSGDAAEGEGEEHGVILGPGMDDDGRPKLINNMDWVAFKEMLERRNMTTLADTFGGLAGMADRMQTNLDTGVDSSTVEARIAQFGENMLSVKEAPEFLEFLIDAFGDEIVRILCVAAAVSIIFGMTLEDPHTGKVERESGWIEGTAIVISVLLVTLTGAINNYQKALKFYEMERAQSVKDLQVYRDGKEVTISSDTLVVGDILQVETGMEMSCDALYITGSDLKMNESALTGEPDLIEKGEENRFVISGTSVDEGDAKVLVIAVGMGTVQGTLKRSLDEESSETPLQEHLGELADHIGKFGLGGAILLLVALSLKEIILITEKGKTASATNFLNFVLISITLIAVAIPEGLPLAVTISLAFSMKAMMKDNCMVRVLASCETMGAATAIASDKTGTLTMNQMTVVQGVIAEEEFVIKGYGLAPRTERVTETNRDSLQLQTNSKLLEQFCYSLAVNSTARRTMINDVMTWVGNKTEYGLLGFVERAGYNFEELRARTAATDVRQYPFSSAKKRMTTIIRGPDGRMTAYIKGASEAVLSQCNRYVDASGEVVPLAGDMQEIFGTIIEDIANQGNRTIGVGFAQLEGHDFPAEEPDVHFVFQGVMGIQDPIREEVPIAVTHAQSAGLTVRMVTGDNINTAKAIGAKCNIYNPDGYDYAMTGEQFRKMFQEDKDELVKLLPRIRILARSSPTDKHILVGLLQDCLGEVVGVTGDGTNDAPALKLADVGFAMNSGTDIAKGAADMVLLDDNFATVVTAIKWGRAVNDNIKKFLQYQLAINIAGVLLTLIGSLSSDTSKEPFTPVQLLWLNLIMDTLAAIALATELPEDKSLERPPVFKQAPLITNHMLSFIGMHSAFQFTLIMVLLFEGHKWFNLIEDIDNCDRDFVPIPRNASNLTQGFMISPQQDHCLRKCEHTGGIMDGRQCRQGLIHSTMIFNIFIFCQIFNVINARKIYGEWNPLEGLFTRSQNLLKVFLIIVALQVIAVELFGQFMETTGLKWDHWLICVGLASIELLIGIANRALPIRDHVPDFVERKAADEKAAREQHSRVLTLHKSDRRNSMIVNKSGRRGSVTQ